MLVSVRTDRRELFQLFGQCVCYDITYNVVRRIRENDREINLGLGVFSGMTNTNGIIVYGFSLLAR